MHDRKICSDGLLALTKMSYVIKQDCSKEIFERVKFSGKSYLYSQFVKQFFSYIPVDYRSKNEIAISDDCVDEVFNFFIERNISDDKKIAILPSFFQKSAALNILVNIDDQSFLLDSLHNLIKDLNLQTVFVFHQAICCKRDKQGNLIEIFDNSNISDGKVEFLFFIKVIGTFDQEKINLISSKVQQIIYLVQKTCNSWNLLLTKASSIIKSLSSDDYKSSEIYKKGEILQFLQWLSDNHFTFFGIIDFEVDKLKLVNQLGVTELWDDNLSEIYEIVRISKSSYYDNTVIIFGKINKMSPLHRNILIDCILIKHLDDNGNYKSGYIILGLYGSALYYESLKNIPILRNKISSIIGNSKFSANSYRAKKLRAIIESLPRETLIQVPEDDLLNMSLAMKSTTHSNKLKLFIQEYCSNSFVNVMIFMRREKLSAETYKVINDYLEKILHAKVVSNNISVVAEDFVIVFLSMSVNFCDKISYSIEQMENKLINITTDWSDSLYNALCDEYGQYDGGIQFKEVCNIFPLEYQHKYCGEQVINDLYRLKKVSETKRNQFALFQINQTIFHLKIYSLSENYLTLSSILPDIENLGFHVVSQQIFEVKSNNYINRSLIYAFKLTTPNSISIDSFSDLKYNIESALSGIYTESINIDNLGKLLVLISLDVRQIMLVKGLSKYLKQTMIGYDKDYIASTLIEHYKYTKLLVLLFEYRFNPSIYSTVEVNNVINELRNYLDCVRSATEDRILRNMYLIIMAIVRTNFYQKLENNNYKNYISFKFDSSKIPDLPLPIPYSEIFVYSNNFEGIHLRGGGIARGGIRWSNRGGDYRTEVLGLMKAQLTKNTVIVPSGSKGGFYVFPKKSANDISYGVECYQNFLRGMLDLTDNLVDKNVVHPKDVVIYDEDSTYLVVAADKGTNSFSDYANLVAAEYKFWLGDAFASGGSKGYDHKKIGITSKGAWISVQNHFARIGIDVQKENITVVGIGDMSGDVFGNGMLMSDKIRLIAAFNHEHIFIDPNPDSALSYSERRRLFSMPSSKWIDYNRDLISEGGGVFERKSKLIKISHEIQKMFHLTGLEIDPNQLIRAILKARVDLIWNGGIGTYIKSSSEADFDIGDKDNDVLRINGNEVHAKVIVEGGNLGLSQLGRIEYALNGGILNTDFIDNSAGVDCSDHEVNIKIALNSAVSNNKITIEERDKLLEEMTNDVERLVLHDNYEQNKTLSILELSSADNTGCFIHFIKFLEKAKLLNRKVEFLPSPKDLLQRSTEKKGMARPELSVLLSYVKMYIDSELLKTNISDEEFFNSYLYNYFPHQMRERFSDEIILHPLSRDIIRTVIVNKFVNQLGIHTIYDIYSETGAKIFNIVKVYFVVAEILELDLLVESIKNLSKINYLDEIKILSDLQEVTKLGVIWFINNVNLSIDMLSITKLYKNHLSNLKDEFGKYLSCAVKHRYMQKKKKYLKMGLDKFYADNIANIENIVSMFDVIDISVGASVSSKIIMNIYCRVDELFHIDWLRYMCSRESDSTYWGKLSFRSLRSDLYDKQKFLVNKIVSSGVKNSTDFKKWAHSKNTIIEQFLSFISEIKAQDNIDFSMLLLCYKKLDIMIHLF